MYFANAHAAGKTVQSTAYAAVLLENSFFTNSPNVYGSVYVNGGLVGNAMKVVNSSIVNSSGNKGFAQTNQASFSFNAPWVTNAPPYGYTNWLDPLANVPNVVTNWAGVGKITSF
jgi:pectate lyase